MSEHEVPPSEDMNQSQQTGDAATKKIPRINTFFKTVTAVNGSDIHIKSDAVPRVRVGGELKTLKTEPLSPAEVDSMVEEMLRPDQLEEFRKHGTLDTAYAVSKADRFRVNIFRQRGTTSIVARRINPKVPSYADLHLPDIFSKSKTKKQRTNAQAFHGPVANHAALPINRPNFLCVSLIIQTYFIPPSQEPSPTTTHYRFPDAATPSYPHPPQSSPAQTSS